MPSFESPSGPAPVGRPLAIGDINHDNVRWYGLLPDSAVTLLTSASTSII